MWLVRRILVPIDFSDGSELALDRALDMASQLGATVTVMHATSTSTVRLEPTLQALIAARSNRGVEIRTEFRRGPAISTILGTAEELRADLIVVGSHARRGAAKRVLGSVAEEIARSANVPVLVVHQHEPAEKPAAPPFGLGHEAGVRQP